MRVLIAVNQQRRVRNHQPGVAVDGEIVSPVVVPCTDPDGCRCDRSWVGVATTGLSALAEVVDRPNLTRAAVRAALHDLLDEVGWIDELVQAVEAGDTVFDGIEVDDPVWATEQMIDEHLRWIDTICETFPTGTVLSRLGDLVAPTAESLAA